MSDDKNITDLQQLLDRIAEAADEENDRVSLSAVLKLVGRRSFGPVLLVAGLITVAPVIGDIPGVPTLVAALLLLIAGQLVLRRDHIWLPHWLLERSVERERLCHALEWIRRPARFLDRIFRPRLTVLTNRTGSYAIALVCAAIAAVMPLMEVVPFSANGAGAALTAFGLSLVAHDGLMALFALFLTTVTFGFVTYGLL